MAGGGLAVLLAIPAAMAAVPTDALASAPTLCLWKLAFDVECPGCGMGRALSCWLHLDFARAWAYNRLIVVVGPLLAVLWMRGAWALWRAARGGQWCGDEDGA